MSWSDYYRRRDAMDLVLALSRRHGDTALHYDDVPEAKAVFADREELALALQYRWSQILMGRIGVALSDVARTPELDNVEAVATALRTAAATEPDLHDVLDAHLAEAGEAFRAAVRAEQRMVAFAAGLAEPGEPAEETARIGAAFIALVHAAPGAPSRRRSPVEQLLRRLVASA